MSVHSQIGDIFAGRKPLLGSHGLLLSDRLLLLHHLKALKVLHLLLLEDLLLLKVRSNHLRIRLNDLRANEDRYRRHLNG